MEPLIARSGLSVEEWVARLHEVTLPPLLHMLYRYGAAFSPHAQNCMLVLRDDAPARLVVKDFVDDMMVSSDPLPELADMPGDVRAALGDGVEAAILVQWIQGGLLVCVHRYLAEILEDRLGYAEASFWAAGERAVARYQARFPELEDRFALFDMEAPAFVKLCLNRVRMLERGYNDAASRPVAAAVGLDREPAGAMSHSELAVHTEYEPALGSQAVGASRAARVRHRAAVDVDAQAARGAVLGDGLAARTGFATTSCARTRTRRARRCSATWTTWRSATSRSTTRRATCSGAHAPILPGDIGAHVLIGDEEHLGRYSVAIGRAVVRFLFKRPGVLRIVGEPDVRNHQFLSLLAFLGFRKQGEIDLPDKRAAFMVCERSDFERLSARRRRVSA